MVINKCSDFYDFILAKILFLINQQTSSHHALILLACGRASAGLSD